MITSSFINAIFYGVNSLVDKLPNISINSSIGTSISTASGYISGVYSFIPAITISLLAIIAFDILFESSYLLYKIIYWIIRRLPTQS